MKKVFFTAAVLLAAMTTGCEKQNPESSDTVTDICGNTYKIVTIGNQVWMAENLRCNKYDTQSEAYNASWLTDNTLPTSSAEVYTPYFADATDKTKWNSSECAGALSNEQIAKLGYQYNWAAAVGVADGKAQTAAFTGNRQGICPNGWHMPSAAEWETLRSYTGGSDHNSGKRMKTTSGWYQNGSGTDDFGFAALPSGHAEGNIITNVGKFASFWSATPLNEDKVATGSSITYDEDGLDDNRYNKNNGHSVRCIKN